MMLKEVVNVKPILRVIDFQSEDKGLIDGYVVMDQTAQYFTEILEGFTRLRDEESTGKYGSIQLGTVNRCHKITGTYGVGKSYFILMLKAILESLEDKNSFDNIAHKFEEFKSVSYQLEALKNGAKKYIVVSINGKNFSELDFKSVIESQIYKAIVEKIGRENLHFTSFFKRTVGQLIEWRKSNSPLYKEFERKFKNDIDYTYDEMIEDLENRKNGAKEKFIKVYEDILKQQASDTFDSLDEFLDEADENAINNGYDGIVVLFDEFSTYLRGRLEKGYLNIDLGSIDILAEKTILSSAKKIHFITTEHEDIENIFKKALDNMETVNKTAGRFKNYTLHFEKGARLVQNVIVKDVEKFKLIKFENSNIFDDYLKVNSYAKLEDIYPINPFTLEYLVKISERYAQGDRTLFSFIDEKLRAFIETNDVLYDGNHLNLLGIDAIMETFESDILHGREEFAKAYNTQIERTKKDLQKKVVKALGLDYAVTVTDVGKIKSGINGENIKYILSLSEEETKEIRDYLLKEQNDSNSYIIFNEGTNGYELSPDVQGIDIEEEINKELIYTDEKKFLGGLILNRSAVLDIKNRFIIPKESKVFPFERTIEGKFIKHLGELKQLSLEDELNDCKKDGKIIFYIPPAGQSYDYNVILNAAKSKIKELESNRIIIAVPKSFNFSGTESIMLKRFEAVQRLTKQENIMDNPKAVNLIRLEIVKLRTQIYNNLGSFGRAENFVFLFKDEMLDYVNNMQQMLTDWLVKEIYTRFPVVNAEDFSSRSPSNLLIQNLVVPRKIEKVDLSSSKVHAKQIRDTLIPLCLVKLTETPHGDRVEIKSPTEHIIMSEIFEILATSEKQLTIKDKYKLLTSPPYGLNDPLFELFFALFIQISDKYYLKSKDDVRIEVTQENMNSLWNKEYALCVTQDAVSFNVKKDAINILEIIDKAYLSILSYKQLRPEDPSDEFGRPEKSGIFIHYIKALQQRVKTFIGNLKFLGIDTPVIENIDNIEGYLEKGKDIYNPTDLLNFVGDIINIYFDNNIGFAETGDINILRYEKFQNFVDNTKWLDNNKDILKKQSDTIKKLLSEIKNIDFTSITNSVLNVKSQLNNILFNKIALDNWKDGKYENNIKLDAFQLEIDSVIEKYNKKYKQSIDILNIEKRVFLDLINNYEYITLIKSAEQIKFLDLTRLGELETRLKDVKVCNHDFNVSRSEIFLCSKCGNLGQVIKSIENIKQEQSNVENNLNGMVNSYMTNIDELVDLNEVKIKYNKNETIIDYIQEKCPDKLEKARELIRYLRYSWEDNIENITVLVDELYPIINEYIKPSEVIKPGVVKKISYIKIINKINDLIKFSGFRKMTFEQLEKEISKGLKELKEKFDEITIGD